MNKFWFVTCKHEVLGVELDSEEARLISLGGALLVDCAVITITADGLRGKTSGQAFEVAGLFLDQETAIKAADLPRDLKPWDNWFWDRTRPVLQAIGWHNPKLGLRRSAETVPASEAELRFRSMLPDHPLAARPA